MLSVRNAARAVEFYQQAFGATVPFRIDAPDGAVVARLEVAPDEIGPARARPNAGPDPAMAASSAEFWVADESPAHLNFSPQTLGGGTVRMVMVVDDPDAVFARAVAAGAKAVHPVADQPYGWRVGRLVDPFGHHWEIGKPLQKSEG